MTTERRYQEAIKKIGGAASLLCLPEEVKDVLKKTMDLETKTQLLEAIAERMTTCPHTETSV